MDLLAAGSFPFTSLSARAAVRSEVFRLTRGALRHTTVRGPIGTEVECVVPRFAGAVRDRDPHRAVLTGFGHLEGAVTLLDGDGVLLRRVLDRLTGLRIDRVGLAGLRVHLQLLTGHRIRRLLRVRHHVLGAGDPGGTRPTTGGATTTARSTGHATAARPGPGSPARGGAGLVHALPLRVRLREGIRVELLPQRLGQRRIALADRRDEALTVPVELGGLLLIHAAELTQSGLGLRESALHLLELRPDVVLSDLLRKGHPENRSWKDRPSEEHSVQQAVAETSVLELLILLLDFLNGRRQLFLRRDQAVDLRRGQFRDGSVAVDLQYPLGIVDDVALYTLVDAVGDGVGGGLQGLGEVSGTVRQTLIRLFRRGLRITGPVRGIALPCRVECLGRATDGVIRRREHLGIRVKGAEIDTPELVQSSTDALRIEATVRISRGQPPGRPLAGGRTRIQGDRLVVLRLLRAVRPRTDERTRLRVTRVELLEQFHHDRRLVDDLVRGREAPLVQRVTRVADLSLGPVGAGPGKAPVSMVQVFERSLSTGYHVRRIRPDLGGILDGFVLAQPIGIGQRVKEVLFVLP